MKTLETFQTLCWEARAEWIETLESDRPFWGMTGTNGKPLDR